MLAITQFRCLQLSHQDLSRARLRFALAAFCTRSPDAPTRAQDRPRQHRQVFAKLKQRLRNAQVRTSEAVSAAIGTILDTCTPQECANCLRSAGYASTKSPQ